ncbi:hypothetical protein Tco_0014435 [Tanacetum coccineum]
MENEHPEQPESSNDIYLTKQGDTNITIDSLDICNDRAQDDQDDTDDITPRVASDDLRDALSVIFGLSELKDHVPVYIPEPEHLEDLVPAEDEAPIEAYITEVASTPPPSFLPSLIQPPHTRAAMAHMRAAAPSTYHPLLPSGTPPLLPIPLPAPSTSCKADIPEADTPPRKRLLLTTPRPRCEVGESSTAAAARQPGPTMTHRVDCSFVDTMETKVRDTKRRMMAALEVVKLRKDHAAVRAKIEVLRRERLAYEQESIQTRQDLARSEAYSRALEARVTVLETEVRRHEWQRQAVDDLAI